MRGQHRKYRNESAAARAARLEARRKRNRIRCAEYYAAHKDKWREYNATHHEQRNQARREHYAKHREEINRGKRASAEHKAKAALYARNRRARIKAQQEARPCPAPTPCCCAWPPRSCSPGS